MSNAESWVEEAERREAKIYKKVVKEMKRRATEEPNDSYYRFGHYEPSKSLKKMEQILFKGNMYTCMLKYEEHVKFLQSQILCAQEYYCDVHDDEDYEPSVKEIIKQIIYCMKNDDSIYMIKMTVE